MPNRGKDPTPQGRTPQTGPRHRENLDETPALSEAEHEKFVNSAPGPDQTDDGAYWFGYKKPIKDEGTPER